MSKKEIDQKIKEARQKRAEYYAFIKNRQDLIEYLKKEDNQYTEFILSKIDNPPPTDSCTEIHHIIPKHDGGPITSWNEIKLTVEDHLKAHELRYQVYKQPGDLNTVKLRKGEIEAPGNVEMRIKQRQKRADETRKQKGTGIYEEGASVRGGKVSSKETPARIKSFKQKMTLESLALFEKGSLWEHDKTNTVLKFAPGEIQTYAQLKKRLGEALPEGSADKESLLRTSKNNDPTSNLSKVVNGERPRANGWQLILINCFKSS